ncbi:IclR family transcriptional regulator [Thermohalobaculum xanthum]|uniref:IclR family transcriptional regulator n=1 Tax=Thermohalobaculum xanthum TaxID=2753746 RepID=UPI001F3EEC14|nr:IclR family transcriptional regulator C-terminal domain-containing protein [Thermohalobaculum xanthum]
MEIRTEKQDTLFVASLAKGLKLLRAFDEGHTEMALSELAARAGLDRSATQRLANTLHQQGFLEKDPVTRRFRPSHAWIELAYAYLWSDPLIALSSPKLIELSHQVGETVNMSELSGMDIVYVTRLPSPRSHFAATLIGRRIPALVTSSGRAILATLPEEERRAAIANWPVRQYTPLTTLDRGRIAGEVAEAVERGYSISKNELILNEIGVAAPILDPDGRASAAVHCSVSAFHWTTDRVEREIVPYLLDTANGITPPRRHR